MSSLGEFFHMGGYANYVWSAFGISFFVLLFGFIVPLLKERRTPEKIRMRNNRREQKNESTTT